MSEEPIAKEKVPLLMILKKRLVHHEAKVGQIREAIEMLEKNPGLELIYELFSKSKG